MEKSPVKMSSRLHRVADMITPGMTVADIGTDHGYIPIYQVLTGRTGQAYACDVVEGPLGRARDNVKLYHVEDRVDIMLSDGLEVFKSEEVKLPESIVIAGMGGCLICRILDNGMSVARKAKELVLSPHSEWYEVRSYLMSNGFSIIDEDMVKEDGKFYVIIKAVPAVLADDEENEAAKQRMPADSLALHFGPVLMRKEHPVLLDYLKKEKDTCNKILDNLKENGSASSHSRRDEIIKWKDILEEAIAIIMEV